MKKNSKNFFDIIIVGGGHAGCEAAAAAARMGATTLLVTQDVSKIGEMSCNPAIGGIGKGHLVKEIDALDGIMARAADEAGIQFRLLNRSRGAAVRGNRCQADRKLYKKSIQGMLSSEPSLKIYSGTVIEFIKSTKGSVKGVKLETGEKFCSEATILTTGTFLNGMIHIGTKTVSAGRTDEPSSISLARDLRSFGLKMGRLKTGTPPRLNKKSIDWAGLEGQKGDENPEMFSVYNEKPKNPQIDCKLTYTNKEIHALIKNNIQKSAMYSGKISAKGPRYCPSIEDKIMRFSDRDRHQIFLEPEGLTDNTVYPNGVSTSLPEQVQKKIINLMPGLEKAKIMRPGYAIEYDFVDPRECLSSLELRSVPNLFLAGQINGTTGYEEAASQGIVAGINASLKAQDKNMWAPSRENSYIGVMIDDLITQGAPEPYRMFTSRAEHRLFLREDNADKRLTAIGWELGSVTKERLDVFNKKQESIEKEMARLKELKFIENNKTISANDYLKRPNTSYNSLLKYVSGYSFASPEIGEKCAIKIKYEGYIARQNLEIKRNKKDEETPLPEKINYSSITALSIEARENLTIARPQNLRQASRVPGVTPAAISILKVQIKAINNKKEMAQNAK